MTGKGQRINNGLPLRLIGDVHGAVSAAASLRAFLLVKRAFWNPWYAPVELAKPLGMVSPGREVLREMNAKKTQSRRGLRLNLSVSIFRRHILWGMRHGKGIARILVEFNWR